MQDKFVSFSHKLCKRQFCVSEYALILNSGDVYEKQTACGIWSWDLARGGVHVALDGGVFTVKARAVSVEGRKRKRQFSGDLHTGAEIRFLYCLHMLRPASGHSCAL